jgi:hypothetical protein
VFTLTETVLSDEETLLTMRKGVSVPSGLGDATGPGDASGAGDPSSERVRRPGRRSPGED